MSCGPDDDLVRGRRSFLVLWGLPMALVALGLVWSSARVWLWVPAGGIAGTACLANASRCGRLHCFLTGPLFLLGAAATLASHFDLIALAPIWILAAMIVGTALGYAAEWARGAYVRTPH
jgi:hypothetical protein